MTRETKIGLLVGLAFIIVIGILLSDHMTSTTQPPQAALAEAAPNVRESVTIPAPVNPGPAPLSSVPPITPSNRVPTQGELRPSPVTPAAPVVSHIAVGPSPEQSHSPITIRQTDPAPAGPFAKTTEIPAGDQQTVEQWAQGAKPDGRTPVVPVTPVAPAAAGKVYVAQVGDSLSRITAKFYGTNTKAGRDVIIQANASLQKNPEIVVEGRKYTIPAAPAAPTVAVNPAAPAVVGPTGIPETVAVVTNKQPKSAPKAIPVTELVEPLPANQPAPAGGSWYVVKDNDNLWKIASDQMGSGNAWQQLRDINKDILKGGDTVQPNMRLRIPGKPLASIAN